MKGKSSYIEDVSISNADNGVIVRYCERTKSEGKGCYDSYDYKRREEVFNTMDEDGDEGFEEAFNRFKELFMQARNHQLSKKK